MELSFGQRLNQMLNQKAAQYQADKDGVIYGRFQMLHLKHVEYILAAKVRCKKLWIGITGQDARFLDANRMAPELTKEISNPFSYYERCEMLRRALREFGLTSEQYEIVPFPIEAPEYVSQYVSEHATIYMGICDECGKREKQMLEQQGFKVEVLWERTLENIGITGAEVRNSIIRNEKWSHLVPKSIYEYVIEQKLDERIRNLAGQAEKAEQEEAIAEQKDTLQNAEEKTEEPERV